MSDTYSKKDLEQPYQATEKVYSASVLSENAKYASTSIEHRKFGECRAVSLQSLVHELTTLLQSPSMSM